MRNRLFDETHYFINVPKTYDGPSTILVLADIHDGFVDEIITHIESIKTDIILIPGDLCNEHIVTGDHYDTGKRKYGVSEKGLSFIKYCVTRCSTYYSRGNHEWMFDKTDIEAVKREGAIFLENSYIQYSEYAYIGAVSSPLKYERNGIIPEYYAPDTNWIPGFEKNKGYKILMCHHPEYYSKYLKNRDINLIISGHAHGGQIRIGNRGLWAPGQGFFPKMTSGFIDDKIIISRGLANTSKLIPRINNRPEVVVLELIKCR